MLFSNDRQQMRQFFFTAWQKHQAQQPLESLEQQLVSIMLVHPEYHSMLNNAERYLGKDYMPEMGETNLFLHMALHLSVIEQITTDRPAGIRAIYQQLSAQLKDNHAAEHHILACIAENMWQAQRHGTMADDATYLQQLKKLLR